jgi:hypothetical protein
MKKQIKPKSVLSVRMIKAGFPLCYGNEHCATCKKVFIKICLNKGEIIK